jgi:hypothetical protein
VQTLFEGSAFSQTLTGRDSQDLRGHQREDTSDNVKCESSDGLYGFALCSCTDRSGSGFSLQGTHTRRSARECSTELVKAADSEMDTSDESHETSFIA